MPDTPINPERLPKHVALIMDGNGRWARARKLPRVAGHQAGIKAARQVIELSSQWGIETLSLFAFGRDNWRRPAAEVVALQSLMARAIDNELDRLHANQVCLQVIGDITQFQPELQEKLQHAKALTADNTGLNLIIALNYSGQWHIAQVVKRLAQAGVDLDSDDVEQMLAEQMCAEFPEPELFIRTSGVSRLSNYYLWHLAYTELVFLPMHWPNFDEAAYRGALAQFAQVERRFGQTSEQVQSQGAQAC